MLENNEPISGGEEDLFGFTLEPQQPSVRKYNQADLELIAAFYSGGFNPRSLENPARHFFELNADAFTAFVHAWMSELPIEAEMLAFGRKVLAARERRTAEKAASDRGDDGTRTVLNTAGKVQFEIHRMYGLLRFSPSEENEYIARFAPDFLILPALGGYFTSRFGETPWAIIDEKRGLVLSRLSAEDGLPRKTEIIILDAISAENSASGDEWENLWRHYHKTINNESRYNPNLQRQLMPKRYWKYLPEV
ncbi:MAG: TIGR03915 family putative DNA repair protein [Treponema sp.]|nr:TIGR03915 family putative DNA repair protein [Treponema sp.]